MNIQVSPIVSMVTMKILLPGYSFYRTAQPPRSGLKTCNISTLGIAPVMLPPGCQSGYITAQNRPVLLRKSCHPEYITSWHRPGISATQI